MTKHLAVLGSPIEHSKSPIIHAAAYRVLGLDWSYGRNEIVRGALKSFLDKLDESWIGLSLTMPLKDQAAKLAVYSDEITTLTGSANTLVRSVDGWHAFNTDVFGITESLRRANLNSLQSVLLVGSGATAKSAIVALSKFCPEAKIYVQSRNRESLKQLVGFGRSLGMSVKSTKNFKRRAQSCSLTISTLPALALDDLLVFKKYFQPKGALFDVAYDPWPSKAATLWSSRNQTVISGLEMLIWQAVAQIRIFTATDPERELDNEIAVIEAMRHSIQVD